MHETATAPSTPSHAGTSARKSESLPIELSEVRREIEEVDRSLVELLARRCRLARRAGVAKEGARLALLDPRQEAAVVRRGTAQARAAGIDPEGVRSVLWRVIALCRRSQRG